MKLEAVPLVFIIVLLTVLFLFLKSVFFKPIIQVMDERDQAIQAGAARRAEATALVEQRQADYGNRLRDLRNQAFEHRKALAAAAAKEKLALLDQARREANSSRSTALEGLRAAQEAAKAELMTQVETLSESMVQHLLRQA
jgi:F-type H+-transporting ATPase subunit b